jgi:hypothetical protein
MATVTQELCEQKHGELLREIQDVGKSLRGLSKILLGNGELGLVGRVVVQENELREHVASHAKVRGGAWDIAVRIGAPLLTSAVAALGAAALVAWK